MQSMKKRTSCEPHHHFRSLEVFGSAKVASRGQLVLPVKARRALKIKPGDTMIVFGHEHGVTIVKASAIKDVLNRMADHFSHQLHKLRKELTH